MSGTVETTSTAVGADLQPPQGYPFPTFQDDGTYAVARELRAAYIAAAEAGRGSEKTWWSEKQHLRMQATVPNEETGEIDTVAVEYPLFAHIDRRDQARRAQAAALAAAENERRFNRDCAVCGARGHSSQMVLVQAGGVQALACRADAPALQVELRARETTPDGRTRQQLVTAAADRLLSAG